MTDLTTTDVDWAPGRAGAAAPVRNLLARVLGVKTAEQNWRVGSEVEEKVGKQLGALPDCWHQVQSIPVGSRGSDVDHLVIGPGGVFSLTTKHHPGGAVWLTERGVRVNGQSMPYLQKARSEAERASKLLTIACSMPVDVQAVIVFVDIAKLVVKGNPDGVAVTTSRELRRYLTKQPVRLTQVAADHIFVMAGSSVTWQAMQPSR